ncbi:DUF4232 domain-containing protein [Amycolatopsis pithecellobii]|uniref:DUF4232 domain-containing protein n=1 Tax=Amycolatopsis pithecellobii TaxID=664692 RepID=A0A6N7Z6A3_9PSEU|nr:DUF4232 domain-containing protein [Amycolatopsis pithecellobii]MTD56364.1 DUF4232 domain-containing protein [Amycolatopsis pithecellobii]
MVRTRISQLGLAAGAAAVALTVVGCGTTNNAGPAAPTTPASSSAPTENQAPTDSLAPGSSVAVGTEPSATPAAPAQPAGNGLCKAADLKLSFGAGDSGAGTSYRPLVFTNVGDGPCTIQGFPGVSYVGGADGHQVGKPAERVGDKGAPIKLNKGGTASVAIGFVNVQNYDTVTCQPQAVRGLRIYPPQETASMFIELPGTGCANPNIPGDQLTVKTAVQGSNAQ